MKSWLLVGIVVLTLVSCVPVASAAGTADAAGPAWVDGVVTQAGKVKDGRQVIAFELKGRTLTYWRPVMIAKGVAPYVKGDTITVRFDNGKPVGVSHR